jgi:CRP-like cAMP-binding protein
MSLEAADAPIEYAYFIEAGMASVVASVGSRAIETGVIGDEGMTGTALVYGDDRSPFETFVQGTGKALRIEAGRLQHAMVSSPRLHALLLKYARAFAIQVTCTAFANGRSKLDERLARWLLMVSDRSGLRFSITHEFLALMLAVRRPGVTLALQVLEGHGLIKASRGQVWVIDREGLIEAANGGYGLAEKEYVRLMPCI